MNTDTDWDVVVVGAGPGGCAAAEMAAQNGAKVLLIERKAVIGVPVQCAEHIPLPLMQHLAVPERLVCQRVQGMHTHLPSGSVDKVDDKGVIIHRHLFDQWLAHKAQKAGATILTHTTATAFDGTWLSIRQDNAHMKVKAKVFIGADGPKSSMRQYTQAQPMRFVYATQARMRLKKPMEHTACYFRRYIPGGYGWVFPRVNEANVGLGVQPGSGRGASSALSIFIDELVDTGIIHKDILARFGGLIPVGGVSILRKHNILLVGDAAGHCHPITGAGIAPSIYCGELAGHAAAEAAQLNGHKAESALKEYEEEAQELMGPSLSYAVHKRRLQEAAFAQNDDLKLEEVLKTSWISFPAYHADRREKRFRDGIGY